MVYLVWKKTWRSKILLFLLATDLIFIGLHFLHFWLLQGSDRALWEGHRFAVSTDRGFAEIFGYLKLLLLTGLLARLWTQQKRLTYFAWSAVFAYVGLDDALRLHEKEGLYLAQRLGMPAAFGLRARDLGEVLVWGVFATVLLGFVLFSYLRAAPKEKAFSKSLFALFTVLVFFGLGVDMLDILVGGSAFQETLMAVLEDGGEMLTISVITAFVWRWFVNREPVHQTASGRAQRTDGLRG